MVKVFHNDAMVADAQSFSPSAGKPRAVVDSWRRRFPMLEFVEPTPVDQATLSLAHDRAYVRDVLALKRDNGFGNRLPEVAASLPWTCGAMRDAAFRALDEGIAGAPVSGFHHAGHEDGGGFCTFNGLLVAALALHRDRGVQRVGILDFDHHYGNGSSDITRTLGLHWIEHYSAGAWFQSPEQAPAFLAGLDATMQRFARCDVLLYQAGADPHIDDALGGWLTTAQLRERDRSVFHACRAQRLPVEWNLAGGYQTPLRKVLDIHDNTMAECLAAFADTSDREPR